MSDEGVSPTEVLPRTSTGTCTFCGHDATVQGAVLTSWQCWCGAGPEFGDADCKCQEFNVVEEPNG